MTTTATALDTGTDPEQKPDLRHGRAIIEWYEHTVYGTAAPLVFGTLFFPSTEPGVSQIAALASFGVGFLARPVGAFVSGHSGAISDRIGRKKTFFFGAGIIIVSAWPIFAMIQTGRQWAIILGMAIFLALGHAAVYSVLPAFYCELFPTKVLYTGISVGYQTAAILLAGLTPVIVSALVLWSGGTWPLVAIIIVTTITAVAAVSAA